MIKFDQWHLPDREAHLQDWMLKKNQRVEGRLTYQYHKYEPAMKLCKQRRCAVDVGGHVGFFSYWMARDFQQVHAFEPVEAHRACFVRNVEALNVTLHNCALGKEEGSVSIYTAPTSSGDSYVSGGGTIPMRTLDSFNLVNVDFIKIDTEGFEENVLRGAEQMLVACKPVVCVEQKRDMASTRFGLEPLGAVKFLQSLGYRVAQEISGDYIMVAK